MTGVIDAGSIRRLLAGPAVARTFGFALLGRLAYGVLPLCFLLTVRDATGSLPIAAASSGALGLGTLAMPVQARLVDRYGQRRVLPAYAACYVSVLLLSAGVAPRIQAPVAWILVGVSLGLCSPALGPAMRAQWREIAPEGPLRRRAYSLDSVGEESSYLAGPVVAGALLAAGMPRVGLLLAAALVCCGVTALVASPHRVPGGLASARAAGSRAGASLAGPLRHRRLRGLLVVLALFGAGSAAVFVGIAALAVRAGSPGAAGVLEAVMATGAVLGGLLWARFGRHDAPGRVLAALLVLLAGGYAVAAGLASGPTADLVLVGVVLGVGALATSPVFVVAFTAADAAVPAEERTEASTWVTVGANAGTAVGTAAAGFTTGTGAGGPFLLAATLAVCAAAVALLGGRPVRDRSDVGV